MPLRDEQADILGGPILQRPESGIFATFSQYYFLFKSVTLFGLGLLAWIACARGLEHLKKHRELRYRKAMRRKHGIPDSDCRPFAVAYAAAKRTHLEREAQDRKKTTNYVSDHNAPAADQLTNPQEDACLLRRRVPETSVQLEDYQLPGSPVAVYHNRRPEVHSLDFTDRYNPKPRRRVLTPEPLPLGRPSVHRASWKEPVINIDDNEESKKRSFEDESDIEHEAVKKSRIDGDEQADWYAQYIDRSPPRASKDSLNQQPEGSCVHMSGQERFKRVDGLRDEDHELDEVMEGIDEDEDELTGLKGVARGRKRDRTEAGSTFGGDDEEDIGNGRASHHRKRRTLLRKVDIPTRGQKRDREVESPESEGEGVFPETSTSGGRIRRSPQKKRGKKAVSDRVSETSVEDPRASKDLLCGRRRVGDSWEADGVQYKVGDKGERLRLTLVKKARNKYHMPQDSQHPDRSAALEIYVETWMTDEQYNQAEGRRELDWQEASRESSGSKTPDALDSPTKHGKNLLWDSVKCSPTRRPCRQSVVSTRINPFERWQPQPILGRRVASSSTIVSPILPGVADNPTRPGFRSLSKWEKQDREAEAMARIRAKIEQQSKAQSLPQKAVEVPPSVTAPELGVKPLAVPTITFTPAPAATAGGKLDDSTPQSKPNTSTFSFATPPSSSDATKGTTTAISSTPAPGFSLSSSPPASIPSTLLPSAPTAPATTSSAGTAAPFSFGKPPQVPSSTSSATPSFTMPNVFAKEAVVTTQASSTPPSSTLGINTQRQPLSAENASNPGLFPLAKPDVSSSTLPPAVVAPVTTKFQAPVSSATLSSLGNPPPLSFGSAPTSNKTETPAPPISASVSLPESTKPTAPLFSFSSAYPSSSATPLPTSSLPKFSFGQTSTTSTFSSGPNVAPATASQPKPTFKLGQTTPGATDGTSTVPAAGESNRSANPMSAFGAAAGSNGPAKTSPFGTTPAFGNSTFSLPPASATNPFGKPVTVGSGSLASAPPNPTIMPAGAESTISSAPAGVPTSGNPAVFSFGGANSGSKFAEGSKPVSSSGGTIGGTNSMAMFGGNSTEGKPTLAFGTSANGPKPAAVFGGNEEGSKSSIFGSSTEGVKPAFVLGETSKPASVFGGAVEAKSTFMFNGVAGNKATSGLVTGSAKPINTTGPSKPIPTPGSATFGPLSSASPFAFGKKDDPSINTFTPGTQTKPAASFNFGIPSGVGGSAFGQPSASASGDPSQTVFGMTPSTEFGKTGGSSSSSTFTFGKPMAQNQKQEQ